MGFWEREIVHYGIVAVATVLIGLVLLLVLRLPRPGCPKCGAKEGFAITGTKPGTNRAVERRFGQSLPSLLFVVWGMFLGTGVAVLGIVKEDWPQTIAGVVCIIGIFWFIISRPVIRCNVCGWEEGVLRVDVAGSRPIDAASFPSRATGGKGPARRVATAAFLRLPARAVGSVLHALAKLRKLG